MNGHPLRSRLSGDAIDPLATGGLGGHHVETELFSHHPRQRAPDRVRLPARTAHQLEDRRAARILQGGHHLRQLGAGATGLNNFAYRGVVDCWWRGRSLLTNGGVSGICQQVAVASLDDSATLQQPVESIRTRATLQGGKHGDPAFGVPGSGSDNRRLGWGEFLQGDHYRRLTHVRRRRSPAGHRARCPLDRGRQLGPS